MMQRIRPDSGDTERVANEQLEKLYFDQIFGQLRGVREGDKLTNI
jgi:hypothetical protein